MPAGPMRLFSSAVSGILDGSLPGLVSADLSAHLMSPDAEIDAVSNQTLADLQPHLIESSSLSAQAIQGKRLNSDAQGNVAFITDAIIFGSYVTTPPFRYLVFSYGLAGDAAASKALLGFVDLSTSGGALEVVRDTLIFTPAPEGWFHFNV